MQVKKAIPILCLTSLCLTSLLACSHCRSQALASPQNPDSQLSNAAQSPDEQTRKKQEQIVADVLAQFSAAESLMHRGQTKAAIAAYLPLLQTEPDFAALNAQGSSLRRDLDGIQESIFRLQGQDPIQATATVDALTTQRIALEGQQHAVQKLLQLQPAFAEGHANLAHLLLESGAAAESLRHYQDAIRLRPSLAASLRPAVLHAHLVEADRLAKLGRPEAASEYKAALKLDPANASAHFGLGSLYLGLSKAKDAQPELQEAVRLDPALSDAALMLGLAEYRSGQGEEARQQWRRLADSADPRISEEAHGMLDRYLLAPVTSNALPVLSPAQIEVQQSREAVRNYPKEAYAHNNLALALFHDRQKDEALKEVQAALKLNSDSLEAHNTLGMILADKAQADVAVEEYKRALKLDSDNGAIHNNLGVVYFSRRQWKAAEYEFRKALDGEHSDPYAHHNLAAVLLQEGSLKDSIKECGKTLQYDPKFFEAYGTRGLVEDKLGQEALGFADLKVVVQAAGDPSQALLDLADPLRQFAERKTAVRQFRDLLRLYPQTAAGEEALGRLQLAAGQDQDAAAAFQTSVQLDPKRPTVHLMLSRAFLRLGQPADSAAEARQALALEPKSAEALNTLGSALYQLGQTGEGRAQWQAALKLDNKDAARNAAMFLSEFPETKQTINIK